jgi:hypothetical protein
MDSFCRPPTSSLLGGRPGSSTSPSPYPFSASSPNDHGCKVPARFHRRKKQKLRLSIVLYLPFSIFTKKITFAQQKFCLLRLASLHFWIIKKILCEHFQLRVCNFGNLAIAISSYCCHQISASKTHLI